MEDVAVASLQQAVGAAYGMDVAEMRSHPGGFASRGWVADGTWFIKVWEHGPAPERLDLLLELQRQGLPVPAPLRTRSGGLYSDWQGHAFAAFPYVAGRPAGPGDALSVVHALKRVHQLGPIDLPLASLAEPQIEPLRTIVDHPWLRDRRSVVAAALRRFDEVRQRAERVGVEHVVCHRDFGGSNLLLDRDTVAAMLDWEQAAIGPREHDLWIAAEGPNGQAFLTAYGAQNLALPHLEFALLARALRDMTARVVRNVDRPGVDEWGFRRLAKLDDDLDMFRPYCRQG